MKQKMTDAKKRPADAERFLKDRRSKMKQMTKRAGWICFVVVGIALLWSADAFFAPQYCTPQSLLSEEQTAQLYRFPMDLYKATKEDLMQVRGIGEKRAENILYFLKSHPRLTDMKELEQVKGIKEHYRKELEKLFYIP